MAGNKNRINDGWRAFWLYSLLFQPFFWQPMDIHAEETDLFGETILLEGIELNRTSLVMKTGEQASLRANLFPENTTEQPEMIWSSDDPEVVEVAGSGNEASLSRRRMAGGTAVITVTAGGFSAACRVLVTCRSPCSSIIFMQNSSGSNRYELTEGVPGKQ